MPDEQDELDRFAHPQMGSQTLPRRIVDLALRDEHVGRTQDRRLTLELEKREKRYTVDTLPELHSRHPEARVFFVMGADSWADIRTWREWERVLLLSDHIVVTRPGYEIGFDHVTDAVRDRIVDLRSRSLEETEGPRIYITDAVLYDASATELRSDLSDGHLAREEDIPAEVANYIEKYELYR